MSPRRDDIKVVEVRLTGSRADVRTALAALDVATLDGWNLKVQTTKTRNAGQVQTYGRLVKNREAGR